MRHANSGMRIAHYECAHPNNAPTRIFASLACNLHIGITFMIEINNLTNFAVDKKFFTGVAKKVLKGENKGMENISIAFVSPGEIQKLNKKYRKKDKPTDVLSFEKVSHFKDEASEVIICPHIVRENAKESRLSLKKELARVMIHGILHALGYDHETSEREAVQMESKEKLYFSKIK